MSVLILVDCRHQINAHVLFDRLLFERSILASSFLERMASLTLLKALEGGVPTSHDLARLRQSLDVSGLQLAITVVEKASANIHVKSHL